MVDESPHPDPALADRLAVVRDGITETANANGRDPGAITLVVVTKFHPASLVRDLAALGVRDVGESRHQEAVAKHAELAGLELRWHLIGQLQSNKARQVREYADVVHSLDRGSLLSVLEQPGRPVDVFIQLNLTDDPARGGVHPTELAPFAERVLAAPDLRLLGLMAVPGLDDDPARAFAGVRALRDRVLAPIAPEATALSMGMSGDWRAAIAEGATHLRIGTAITGQRPIRA